MTNERVHHNTRAMIGAAALAAQLIAVASGAMPAWLLIWTIPTTGYAAMLPPADVAWLRNAATVVSVVSVVGTLAIIGRLSIEGTLGNNPVSALEALVSGLAVLTSAQAPVWSQVREHRLWLGVATVTLATSAATPRARDVELPMALAWAVIVAAAMLLQVDVLRSRSDARATVMAEGGQVMPLPRLRLAAIGSMLMSVALAGGVIFMVVPHQLGGGGLSARLAHDAGFTNPDEVTERGDAGIDTFGSGYLSLDVRGSLPDTPILRVPAKSPQLWEGTVYEHYSGQDWQASVGETPVTPRRGSDLAVPPAPHFQPIPAHARVKSYYAQVLSGIPVSLVWSPGVPIHLQGDFNGIFQAGYHLRAFGAGGALTSYTVEAAMPSATPGQLSSIKSATGAGSTWLQLPKELPKRVRGLARQVTAGDTTVSQKVVSIENYLRSNERYTIGAPVPSSGTDAVDDFLFKTHEGFCEQFASAATVMLRSVGVDARLVTGLAYGTRQGGTRVITEADAHAWVQVYYDGVGWVQTDPTLNATLLPARPSWFQRIRREVQDFIGAIPGGTLGTLAIALVLAAGFVYLTRRSRTRRREAATGVVLVAFERFSRRHRGRNRRGEAETAREYVERVAGDDPFLAAAVTVLEQECYGSVPPDAATAKEAANTFRR